MPVFPRRSDSTIPARRRPVASPGRRAGADLPRLDAELEPAGHVGPAWGWRGPAAGRAAHVEAGSVFQATTVQCCGLFPFVQGSGAPAFGVPVGRHMLTGETVALEPLAWLRQGLITNPGVFVLGQPGTGKSTIVKRLVTGCAAFGMPAFIPGEPKGEYSALVAHLGGTVIRVGRGLNRINPLDAGPLGQVARKASGDLREALTAEMNARRLAATSALITAVRKAPVTDGEEVLLTAAVRLLADRLTADPTVPDVLRILEEGPDGLRQASYAVDDRTYRDETVRLCWSLRRLCEGALAGIFDGPSDVALDFDRPASLDISAISDSGDTLVAAAMLCTWAWGFAMLDAEAALNQSGTGRRRQRLVVLDEMWRALRAAPGLVERSDQLTRLNRTKGAATVMVTHTLADAEALATESDRAKARGLIERCGVTIMSALPYAELEKVHRVVPLTGAERRLVAGWAAPASWAAQVAHPGRGKYLIKTGERLGIPVQLAMVGAEPTLYDTDQAIRALDRLPADLTAGITADLTPAALPGPADTAPEVVATAVGHTPPPPLDTAPAEMAPVGEGVGDPLVRALVAATAAELAGRPVAPRASSGNDDGPADHTADHPAGDPVVLP